MSLPLNSLKRDLLANPIAPSRPSQRSAQAGSGYKCRTDAAGCERNEFYAHSRLERVAEHGLGGRP